MFLSTVYGDIGNGFLLSTIRWHFACRPPATRWRHSMAPEAEIQTYLLSKMAALTETLLVQVRGRRPGKDPRKITIFTR